MSSWNDPEAAPPFLDAGRPAPIFLDAGISVPASRLAELPEPGAASPGSIIGQLATELGRHEAARDAATAKMNALNRLAAEAQAAITRADPASDDDCLTVATALARAQLVKRDRASLEVPADRADREAKHTRGILDRRLSQARQLRREIERRGKATAAEWEQLVQLVGLRSTEGEPDAR